MAPAPVDPQTRSERVRLEDYSVLEDGVVVGRIFLSPVAPQEQSWMWASGHNGDIRRAAFGYEPTREAAKRLVGATQPSPRVAV